MTNNDQLLQTINTNICYTPLVFERVNKKLSLDLEPLAIKQLVTTVLAHTTWLVHRGKNFYISDGKVELTINAANYRLITASRATA